MCFIPSLNPDRVELRLAGDYNSLDIMPFSPNASVTPALTPSQPIAVVELLP
jgi:hypothetical protein